ncbi:unnamed protein product, partial [Prorocentrum cordatum]
CRAAAGPGPPAAPAGGAASSAGRHAALRPPGPWPLRRRGRAGSFAVSDARTLGAAGGLRRGAAHRPGAPRGGAGLPPGYVGRARRSGGAHHRHPSVPARGHRRRRQLQLPHRGPHREGGPRLRGRQ